MFFQLMSGVCCLRQKFGLASRAYSNKAGSLGPRLNFIWTLFLASIELWTWGLDGTLFLLFLSKQ